MLRFAQHDSLILSHLLAPWAKLFRPCRGLYDLHRESLGQEIRLSGYRFGRSRFLWQAMVPLKSSRGHKRSSRRNSGLPDGDPCRAGGS